MCRKCDNYRVSGMPCQCVKSKRGHPSLRISRTPYTIRQAWPRCSRQARWRPPSWRSMDTYLPGDMAVAILALLLRLYRGPGRISAWRGVLENQELRQEASSQSPHHLLRLMERKAV